MSVHIWRTQTLQLVKTSPELRSETEAGRRIPVHRNPSLPQFQAKKHRWKTQTCGHEMFVDKKGLQTSAACAHASLWNKEYYKCMSPSNNSIHCQTARCGLGACPISLVSLVSSGFAANSVALANCCCGGYKFKMPLVWTISVAQ